MGRSRIFFSRASVSVNGTGTAEITIPAFPFGPHTRFGIAAKAASSGTINVTVELYQGHDGTNFAIPTDASINGAPLTLTDSSYAANGLYPAPFEFNKIVLTGLTDNDASTTVSVWLTEVS